MPSPKSHPSRVRELKLSKSGEYLQTEASHPSRVRELKLLRASQALRPRQVAPLPGA